MAKLYTKVQSDIRAGVGCRGEKKMDSAVLFSYSGGRTPDGGVRVVASAFGKGYKFKIMRITPEGEELYGMLNFEKGR